MRCGIDEAGRGPVMGPMVIAVVCGTDDSFKALGVRDSKLLTEDKREKLAVEIYKIASHYEFRVISESEIDDAVSKKLLNNLEARYIASLMHKGNSYIVDSPDVNVNRFRELLIKLSGVEDIVAEHEADRNYPLVSAASIVAKVVREREISILKKEIGDFGSGYPSDQRTIEFIKNYVNKHGHLPPHTRKSWKTARNIIESLDRY